MHAYSNFLYKYSMGLTLSFNTSFEEIKTIILQNMGDVGDHFKIILPTQLKSLMIQKFSTIDSNFTFINHNLFSATNEYADFQLLFKSAISNDPTALKNVENDDSEAKLQLVVDRFIMDTFLALNKLPHPKQACLSLNRNKAEAFSDSTTSRSRPDFLLQYENVLLLRGEEKNKRIGEAEKDIVRKGNKMSNQFYLDIPALFAYSYADSTFRLYAIMRNPQYDVINNISFFCIKLISIFTTYTFYLKY